MAVMDAGRIRQLGTPVEVFRRPANLFVAGFIGDHAFVVPDPERLLVYRKDDGELVGTKPTTG